MTSKRPQGKCSNVVQWYCMFFLFSFCLLLSGCDAVDFKGDPLCRFEYSNRVKDVVVKPCLRDKIGTDLLPYFNLDNPVVTHKEEVVRVVFSPVKMVDGQMVMFENSFVFVFERCSDRLVEVFEVVRN